MNIAPFVRLMLYDGDKILFMHRYNTPLWNNHWGLVGGEVLPGETLLMAVQRKADQEVGIQLPLHAFTFIHLMHIKHYENEYLLSFFTACITGLSYRNREPHECDRVQFFDIHHLPDNIIPTHQQALDCYHNHQCYSEYGFAKNHPFHNHC